MGTKSDRLEDEADIDAFIAGLVLLGTGGGGNPLKGKAALLEALDRGGKLAWTPIDRLPPDAAACALTGVGSIAPGRALSAEERIAQGYLLGPLPEPPMHRALRAMEEARGAPISVIFATELGGSKGAVPLAVAATLGLAMVDGDCCGRAVPEMTQISLVRAGCTAVPACFADPWGTVAVVSEVASATQLERIGKLLSQATKLADPMAQCARAAFSMTCGELAKHIVPGTLSRALRVGRDIRQAAQEGGDPAEAAARTLGGQVLFRGRVTRKSWEDQGGFMVGTTELEGTGEDSGSVMRIWFKNENHVAWRNDVPVATAPDLICLLHAETGETWTNTTLPDGVPIAVLGITAEPSCRTPQAVEVLGPRHYGFDIPYMPLSTP
ncbi:DUF917 domain-containing protein [Variovorax rhizosphaerae]|uniref:DUF917 domain-containing protein n=1 Tax=Variovorax rhizosphaerae TaxID=1836200 RepID=A0ABU8WU77_9BURK